MTLNISLPASWQELTNAQLLYICALLAAENYTPTELKTYCFVRFARLTPRGKAANLARVYIYNGHRIVINDSDMAAATSFLDWLDTPPALPVRPDKLGGGKAMDAELHGLPFATWLMVDNLWQGFVISKRTELMDSIAQHIVDGCRTPLTAAERYALILWLTGVRQLFAATFPDLFGGSGEGATPTAESQREAMDAQIRALTGGDITKEQTVLESDTWRALTELNAKAREVKELKRV